MGDVERAGISFSFHSDMPMAPGQPLLLMWAGVNRITNEGNVVAPEQRVSRLGALKAVTLDAAYSLQMENEVGSIVPRKLANFTILAENPLTVDAPRIKDIKVWGTVNEGRVLPVPSIAPTPQKRTEAPAPLNRQGTAPAGHEGAATRPIGFASKTYRLAAARMANDEGRCSSWERGLGRFIAEAIENHG